VRYKILRSSITNAPVSVGKVQRPHTLFGFYLPLSIVIICCVLGFASVAGWISLPHISLPGGGNSGNSSGGCPAGYSEAIGDSSKCCPNGYPYYWSSDGKCHTTAQSSQSGGSAYDGTYDLTYTVSVPGDTHSGSGSFTIENGKSTSPYITGSVSANGKFSGTFVMGAGIPDVPITGTFSNTSTFTLSGSGPVLHTDGTRDTVTMQVRKR
jgi:hypothetical protein